MKLARGFCDLNICAKGSEMKQTVLRALRMGYQTIAINTEVIDNYPINKKRKNIDSTNVPPPPKLDITKSDLQRHNITREPVILTRITIIYSEHSSKFLSKFHDVIKQYDIIAFTPTTEAAVRQIMSQNLIEIDILSLNPEENVARYVSKVMRYAVTRDVYFELAYSPCILNSSSRQKTIALAHTLHQTLRSGNVIITSQARASDQLRHPYDVMNLGRFFGLTEAGAKEALISMSHNVVYCAAARHKGTSKCVAQLTLLDDCETTKFEGLDDARKHLKSNTKKARLK